MTAEQITQGVRLLFGQTFESDSPLAVVLLWLWVEGAGWITIREFLTFAFRQVLLRVVVYVAMVRPVRSGRPSGNDLTA